MEFQGGERNAATVFTGNRVSSRRTAVARSYLESRLIHENVKRRQWDTKGQSVEGVRDFQLIILPRGVNKSLPRPLLCDGDASECCFICSLYIAVSIARTYERKGTD